MNLKPGKNDALIKIDSISIPFSIFFLDQSAKLIITDVDGTITKSNFQGFIYHYFGLTSNHKNVVELLQDYSKNYIIIYISARPIHQYTETKKYLFDKSDLPQGPLFLSPLPFTKAIIEAISDPSSIKSSKINEIINLFDKKEDIIYGAYGNENTDFIAYTNASIEPNNIFLVDKYGQIKTKF